MKFTIFDKPKQTPSLNERLTMPHYRQACLIEDNLVTFLREYNLSQLSFFNVTHV